MSIDECIRRLLKRLVFLGYHRFQIRNIIDEAVGQNPWIKKSHSQNLRVMIALQKYEKLGNEYMLAYSK